MYCEKCKPFKVIESIELTKNLIWWFCDTQNNLLSQIIHYVRKMHSAGRWLSQSQSLFIRNFNEQ